MDARQTHTPGYEVTRDGKVFSVASNWRGYGRREMRQLLNSDGYPCVRLMLDGRRKHIRVHVLVAQAYLPPRPSEDHEIRHLDGNRLNPNADNLAWGTRKDNAADRERHGRTSRGEAHSASIKSSNQAAGVRAFRQRQREGNANV